MSIPLEAVTGELHLLGGARQSATRPTAALAAPRHAARGRSGDMLFVLVELRGPEPLPYEAVIDRIEATYWRTPGSVTAALRAALVVTNDWLMDQNLQAQVADRIHAGVSCAALRQREAEVFIAQAGPAAAYVAHHGQVERFPAREVAAQAMGTSRSLDVRFSRAALNPGDAILLCDAATAERAPDDAMAGAIVYTGVQTALQNLQALAGSNDLIALMIEGAAEAQARAAVMDAPQAPPAVTRPSIGLPLWRKRAQEPPPAPLPAPIPVEPTPIQDVGAQEAVELPSVPASAPPLQVRPVKRLTAEEIAEADKARWEQRMEERAASMGRRPREAAVMPPPLSPAPTQAKPSAPAMQTPSVEPVHSPPVQPPVEPDVDAEPVETIPWAQRAGEWVGRLHLRERGRAIAGSVVAGFIVALRGLATLLQRTLPEDVVTGPRGKGVNTALVTIAVLIPAAVGLLVAASYTQYAALEQYKSRLDSARAQAAQAVAFKDPIQQRTLWVSALGQADAALELVPDSADARRVRDEAQRAIDQLDNVVRVAPSLVWNFRSSGPHRLAAHGVNVFVLDRGAGRVFQLTLNEAGDGVADPKTTEPPTRAYKGQNVSERQAGELIDLVWMPLGGARTRASLLILDGGGLLDYDMAWNLRAVALGQGPAPLGARAIAAFGGNLYVLDTIGGQLWRYRPQAEGYGTPQEPYFEKPVSELNSVVDVAIDGNVYLLQADGSIRKFLVGKEAKFNITGLTEPLKKPVAIAADAEARKGAVYVADADGARIVHLNTDGAFVRQIRASNGAFNAVQDVVVDDRIGRLYVMSGGKLYVARIPAAP
jgi:hypothetical protein